MKTIQPVTVWSSGAEKQAAVLSAIASSDNLKDSASFTYRLCQSIGYDHAIGGNGTIELISGSLIMDGEDYQAWETNDYAYDWIASKLNLTITGDYVPPTPPEPIPQTESQVESTQIP